MQKELSELGQNTLRKPAYCLANWKRLESGTIEKLCTMMGSSG